MVASGNKRARTVMAGVETKVVPSSRWLCHAWVCKYIEYNRACAPDIPEWHITKSGQEPTNHVKPQPLDLTCGNVRGAMLCEQQTTQDPGQEAVVQT